MWTVVNESNIEAVLICRYEHYLSSENKVWKKNSGLNGILFIILLFFVIYCYLCLFMSGLMFGFKVVAHLEDDSVGGLQNSITRMLQADPDFGEFILSKFYNDYSKLLFSSVFEIYLILILQRPSTHNENWKVS